MSISVPEDTARGSVDVVTTARKNDGKKKKAKRIPIKKGVRCYVLRKRHKYLNPAYASIISQITNSYRFYIYNIKFDLLPAGHQVVKVRRKDITVIAKGEEEVPYDPKYEKDADVREV